MRLLDLYCGAGGAAEGYRRAGFTEIVGIDIKPQPRYPFDFYQSDALSLMGDLLSGCWVQQGELGFDLECFDAIHASPPCQAFTMAQNAAKNAHAHPNLIPETRALLQQSGLPYVIENVVGAPLNNPVQLCGLAFGLRVKRHRLFESSVAMLAPPCPSHDQDYYVIFGNECRNRRKGVTAGRKNKVAEGRKAMDIGWMSRSELSQAIPPAYTEWIGKRILEATNSTA